jgi:hypothetical protein
MDYVTGLPVGEAGIGIVGIDPTFLESQAIVDMSTARLWCGISDGEWDAFVVAAGDIRVLRELVFMAMASFAAAVDNAVTTITTAATETAEASTVVAPFSHAAKARFLSLRRVARMRCGLTPGDLGPAAVAAAPVVGAVGLVAGPAPVSTGLKLKLSSLVDQGLDVELIELPPSEIRAMFRAYALRQGDFPADHCEPTGDQVSALGQLLSSDRVPYVNFSLWGPFGRRLLQRLVFIAMVMSATGEWTRRELPGPPDWGHWWTSWRVLRVAFILWQAVDVEHLDNYAENLRRLSDLYPTCWFLVYSADVKMRSERFEQHRRILEGLGTPATPFDVARPWNAVFKAANSDAAFWDIEVRHACLAHLTKIATSPDNSTAQPSLGLVADATPGKRKAELVPRSATPVELGAKPGEYTHTRKRAPLCPDYGAGRCSGTCPKGLAHQCAICLQQHPRVDHDKEYLAPTAQKASSQKDHYPPAKKSHKDKKKKW